MIDDSGLRPGGVKRSSDGAAAEQAVAEAPLPLPVLETDASRSMAQLQVSYRALQEKQEADHAAAMQEYRVIHQQKLNEAVQDVAK